MSAAVGTFGCGLAGLPTPLLIDADGQAITTEADWLLRRAELMDLATQFVYGRMPPKPPSIEMRTVSTRPILDGVAVETTGELRIAHLGQATHVRVGLIRPVGTRKVAVIIKNDRWRFSLDDIPPGNKRDLYQRTGRKEVFEEVLPLAIGRGYAICKFIRNDVAADDFDSRKTGVLAMYDEYDWGTLAAWAWAYQPIIDWLVNDENIDESRIIATGHSRGG